MALKSDPAFAMMNGLGNEILVLDLRGERSGLTADEVRALAARPRLKFDQLMALGDARASGAAAFVRIYNADGSEAGACGNGSRCVAWYLLRGGSADEIAFDTRAGRIDCARRDAWTFSAVMGRPRFDWRDIPLAFPVADTSAVDLVLPPGCEGLGRPSLVSMGNPHAVFFVDDLDRFDLAAIGPLLERHDAFPERANVSLARVLDRETIILRVWERGAGLTRACGTAACATGVAAARLGLGARRSHVRLPGGVLTIDWRADDQVEMTGLCELEHEGRLDARLFHAAA